MLRRGAIMTDAAIFRVVIFTSRMIISSALSTRQRKKSSDKYRLPLKYLIK